MGCEMAALDLVSYQRPRAVGTLEVDCSQALGGSWPLWRTWLHILWGSGIASLGLTLGWMQHTNDCPS